MIAASEPQEFVPFGRQQIEKHPGSVILPTNAHPVFYDSFLAQRFSQVNIDDVEGEDWWTMRLKEGVEEELYVSGKTVILSRGTIGKSVGLGRTNKASSRVLDVCYTMESRVKQALWTNFIHIKDNDIEDLPSLCILDGSKISVYTEDGQNFITPLQFKISSIWSTRYGLLLERVKEQEGRSSAGPAPGPPPATTAPGPATPGTFEDDIGLTTMFSLLHPLDEISPLLTVKPGGILTYMTDPFLKVVFTCDSPSICLLCNVQTGEHSIWKLRPTMREESFEKLSPSSSDKSKNSSPGYDEFIEHLISDECRWMCGQDMGLTLHTTSNTNNFSGSNLSSGSACFSFKTAHNRSSGNSSSLPGRGSGGSQHASVISFLHPKLSSSFRKESSHSSLLEDRLGCSLAPALDVEPKPILPELCLEYMWTDSNSQNLRSDSFQQTFEEYPPAKKAFITEDILNQKYLAFLAKEQLTLVRLGLTNTDEIFIGTVTKIEAIDAASIDEVKMVAVLESTKGSIMLYTGVMPVGKLHLAGVSSELASSSYLSSLSDIPRVNSPFLKSSILSSTRVGDELLDDTFSHQISPVPSLTERRSDHLRRLTDQFSSNSKTPRLRKIRDPIGSRFTLEFTDGNLFRFTLPEFASSPLVKECVEVLKNVLQRDCAKLALVKWYAIRNAPGTQDISPRQEWQMFLIAILGMIGYQVESLKCVDLSFNSDCETPGKNTKKMKASDSGTNEDWNYLIKSNYHRNMSSGIAETLRLDPLPTAENTSTLEEGIENTTDSFNIHAPLFSSIHLILFSFHLLYEDLKLNSGSSISLSFLVQLLYQLASDLRLVHYAHYYWRDFPAVCAFPASQTSRIPPEELEKISLSPYLCQGEPVSLFDQVFRLKLNMNFEPYPVMTGVNLKSRNILEVLSVICGVSKPCLKTVVPPGSRCATPQPIPLEVPGDLPNSHRAVLRMIKLGMKREDIYALPSGLSLMLCQAIQDTSEDPFPGWPPEVYTFIGRLDLCHTPPSSCKAAVSTLPPHEPLQHETLSEQILKLRFNKDQRVSEVRKLLDSSEPVTVAISQRPEVSDHEFIEEQERHLYAICTRTMALPIGRGMLNLHTETPLTIEPLEIPRLCLSGRAPPRGTTVELTHIEVVPNMNLWPLFHNGVAAGLEISPHTKNIDSTWIIYNKPKNGGDLLPEHAGFLMALGLSGHLDNLTELNLFNYLNKCHEMTSVGLLLGIAASKRGTMDFRATKLFSVHIESLLPPTSIELDLIQNIQVAALLGIGLIYQGTAHRHIAEVLLAEIGRPPGPEMENSSDRECYSLAAGLGLGLVVLGKGTGPSGLADPAIADTLQYYMTGGPKRPFTGSQKDKYKSPSYQIREGDTVNHHVTGPGATLALGMMYFDTGNMSVAKWLDPPDSEYLLDFICPDMLLLRALARGLILWSSVLPSRSWVEAHVPSSILPYCLVKPTESMEHVDLETMNQAYCNIIAGACMAVGLRFAGSANNEAYETLMHYVRLFVNISTKSLAELPGKSTVETCICVCLLSLSMVMAGTGDLDVLRLCRHLGARTGNSPAVTYGSHLAVHMSLGFLFLGGGLATLCTSPQAVAALLIATFPRFPTHSNDNRYHLQAFRHLYVLAVERRLLIPRDMETGRLCYTHLTAIYLDTPYYRDQRSRLLAPALLPHLHLLKEVRVEDDRYWPIVFKRDKNWNELEELLRRGEWVPVKQRAGCLPYSEDQHGFRTLLAQTLSTAESSSWAVSTNSILAFTSNKQMVQLIKYFLELEPGDGTTGEEGDPGEAGLMQCLASAAYEFTSQDRLPLLDPWIAILSEMMKTERGRCCPRLTWQMRLVLAETLSGGSKSLGLAQAHFIERVLDTWLADNEKLVVDYMKCRPLSGTPAHLTALAGFLCYYGIPLQSQLQELTAGLGPPKSILELRRRLKDYCITTSTIKKIWQLYQLLEGK